ncbi:tetratricopeptide repeat protein [Desulfosarcina sp. BuS5]|uniref:tetratricopeptide repeat protein n=1 Tax=Desulfosarcina sp. BuS5 TaxID=933262 RepID=UPI0018DE0178|nr:tetratricopeptide repeat protein [Desulfosarcina sp. BuS5]
MKSRSKKKKPAADKKAVFRKVFSLWQVQVFLLAAATIAVYIHTLDVPFYFDDFSSIKESTLFTQGCDIKSLWNFSPLRITGYTSFWLNYHWHKFDVTGYHIINLIIHLFAGYAVFLLGRGLLLSPALKGRISNITAKWFPFISAALFLLHPLQTQAVTYIVQRLACMAAMFYIFSLACYVYARISTDSKQRYLWFSGLIFFSILAFFTKQNTVTLPAAVLIIEWIFFNSAKKRLVLWAFFSIILFSAILAFVRYISGYDPFSLEALQALTRDTIIISRKDYLNTQFIVLWKYIRLFLWPAGLHLDYDIPIAPGFFDPLVLCSFAGHLCMLAAAILLKKRFPTVTFAILFYYLAHLVESSLIPIRDLMFEHRTYLPNLGLCLGAGYSAAVWLSDRKRNIAVPIVLLLLLSASAATWQRNRMWRDPVLFWRDCARYSPQKMRPWNTLGVMLLQEGKDDEAEKAFSKAMECRQTKTGAQAAASNLIILYRRKGRLKDALQMADILLKQDLTSLNRSRVLNSKGNIYFAMKQYSRAEKYFKKALEIYPESLFAMNNLGHIFIISGRVQDAKNIFTEILKIDPQHKEAKHNFDLLQKLLKKGRLKIANDD